MYVAIGADCAGYMGSYMDWLARVRKMICYNTVYTASIVHVSSIASHVTMNSVALVESGARRCFFPSGDNFRR